MDKSVTDWISLVNTQASHASNLSFRGSVGDDIRVDGQRVHQNQSNDIQSRNFSSSQVQKTIVKHNNNNNKREPSKLARKDIEFTIPTSSLSSSSKSNNNHNNDEKRKSSKKKKHVRISTLKPTNFIIDKKIPSSSYFNNNNNTENNDDNDDNDNDDYDFGYDEELLKENLALLAEKEEEIKLKNDSIVLKQQVKQLIYDNDHATRKLYPPTTPTSNRIIKQVKGRKEDIISDRRRRPLTRSGYYDQQNNNRLYINTLQIDTNDNNNDNDNNDIKEQKIVKNRLISPKRTRVHAISTLSPSSSSKHHNQNNYISKSRGLDFTDDKTIQKKLDNNTQHNNNNRQPINPYIKEPEQEQDNNEHNNINTYVPISKAYRFALRKRHSFMKNISSPNHKQSPLLLPTAELIQPHQPSQNNMKANQHYNNNIINKYFHSWKKYIMLKLRKRENMKKKQEEQLTYMKTTAIEYNNHKIMLHLFQRWIQVYDSVILDKRLNDARIKRKEKIKKILHAKLSNSNNDDDNDDDNDNDNDNDNQKKKKKKNKKIIKKKTLISLSQTPWDTVIQPSSSSRTKENNNNNNNIDNNNIDNKPRWKQTTTKRKQQETIMEEKKMTISEINKHKQHMKILAKKKEERERLETNRKEEEKKLKLFEKEQQKYDRIILKQKEIEKKQQKELYQQKNILARMHSIRSNVLYYGWKPWRRYIEEKRIKYNEMKIFSLYKCKCRLFLYWKNWSKIQMIKRKEKIEYNIYKKVFLSLKRYIKITLPNKMFYSYNMYCVNLQTILFNKWRNYTVEEKKYYELKMDILLLKAKTTGDVNIKKYYFSKWKIYNNNVKEEKRQGILKDITRKKVHTWLEDHRRERKEKNIFSNHHHEQHINNNQHNNNGKRIFGNIIKPLTLPDDLISPSRQSIPLYRTPEITMEPSSSLNNNDDYDNDYDNNNNDDYDNNDDNRKHEKINIVIPRTTTRNEYSS